MSRCWRAKPAISRRVTDGAGSTFLGATYANLFPRQVVTGALPPAGTACQQNQPPFAP